jgi:outer membrane protein assembly factor BamB
LVSGRGSRDGRHDSYLLALDPATGKELWRAVRPSDAREESLEAFSTPIPCTHAGRTEILVAGGDCFTGHDGETGREIWRWGSWNPSRTGHWRLVPSPVAGDGVALVCAPKGGAVYAVKLGQHGNLDDSALAWKSAGREVSTDVSTPLFYKGRFYVLNSDRRTLACVDPVSGKAFWVGQLDSRAKIEASPTGADDRIFVISHRGEVFVAGTGDEFKVLHTAAMGDEGDRDVRSSIAIAHGSLLIRTGSKLYCVGQGRQAREGRKPIREVESQ